MYYTTVAIVCSGCLGQTARQAWFVQFYLSTCRYFSIRWTQTAVLLYVTCTLYLYTIGETVLQFVLAPKFILCIFYISGSKNNRWWSNSIWTPRTWVSLSKHHSTEKAAGQCCAACALKGQIQRFSTSPLRFLIKLSLYILHCFLVLWTKSHNGALFFCTTNEIQNFRFLGLNRIILWQPRMCNVTACTDVDIHCVFAEGQNFKFAFSYFRQIMIQAVT